MTPKFPLSPAFSADPEKAALEVLSTYAVRTLPVDPARILQEMQIPLVSYCEFSKVTTGRNALLSRSRDALAVRQSGKTVVLYDHLMPQSRLKWTLAHELGHIVLGHLGSSFGEKKAAKTPADWEADRFARALLCPMEVAHLCQVTSVKELEVLTGLSQSAAQNAFAQLVLRRKNRSFFAAKEAKKVTGNFLPFISDYLAEKCEKNARQAV